MIAHHRSFALVHFDNVKGRCSDCTGFDRHGRKRSEEIYGVKGVNDKEI